jgi:hypothetical protein
LGEVLLCGGRTPRVDGEPPASVAVRDRLIADLGRTAVVAALGERVRLD